MPNPELFFGIGTGIDNPDYNVSDSECCYFTEINSELTNARTESHADVFEGTLLTTNLLRLLRSLDSRASEGNEASKNSVCLLPPTG